MMILLRHFLLLKLLNSDVRFIKKSLHEGALNALIVFFDPEGARFQWLLKPGFRHVFACINDGSYWTLFDARDARPVVQTVQTADYDLKDYFEEQGYVVVEIEQGPPLKTPFIAGNCVGLVKALLCIHAPFAVTPFQLYRHLRKAP